ncbi:hypothetical protein Dsin_015234 [Dipteronia sinensis]|uniref:Uncharacterized protein n=1 Tax=Dipteronia sinensis TaxID=43782 RepID=A0AAE0ABL3_9ROSI|nr:hypothetical protein Dsin_015234 [Dipteronia sinensis]
MGSVSLALVARIGREDCSRTKHDPCFSKWQVLVGPSDWEDHSLGKEGVARYRVHNLPTETGPGLYELGIAVSSTHKLDSDDVVVVYIGQADNVRTRLQRYGRSGAHLNNPNYCEPGHFDDIFSRGYPIVYRWAPMKSKAGALKAEARLLDKFDYAWNKGSNVRRRHDDVLKKLNKVPSRNIQFPLFIRKSSNFVPQVFKFSKSQPKLVLDRQGAEDVTLKYIKKNSPEMYKAGRVVSSERSEVSLPFICGVELGNGDLCTSQPVMGRMRCEEHKGLKVNGNISRSDKKVNTRVYGEDSSSSTIDDREYGSSVCGARTPSGSYCTRPVKGNTSCWQHSVHVSDRDSTISSGNVSDYEGASPCGASTQDGSYCRRQVKGGGKCRQHSVHAQVNGGPELLPSVHVRDSSISSPYDWKCEGTSLCGASTQNGSYCSRQVKGGGRCWQHSSVHAQVNGGLRLLPYGYVSDRDSSISSPYDWKCEGTSLCGASTQNGSYCRRQVKGGGRCRQHSVHAQVNGGQRLLPSLHVSDRDSSISSRNDWKCEGTSLCGASTRNGSHCRRKVMGGGRCWQH